MIPPVPQEHSEQPDDNNGRNEEDPGQRRELGNGITQSLEQGEPTDDEKRDEIQPKQPLPASRAPRITLSASLGLPTVLSQAPFTGSPWTAVPAALNRACRRRQPRSSGQREFDRCGCRPPHTEREPW